MDEKERFELLEKLKLREAELHEEMARVVVGEDGRSKNEILKDQCDVLSAIRGLSAAGLIRAELAGVRNGWGDE